MRAPTVALVIASALAAPVAGADEGNGARADALFREGRDAWKAGRYDEACRKLGESLALDPSAGTLANLADCDERRGDLVGALARTRDALRMLGPSDPRRQPIQARIDDLDGRVARLTIHAATGARVTIDGAPVLASNLGTAIAVNPGSHELRAERDGHEPIVKVARIESGQRVELTLADAPEPPKAPKPSPRWPVWVAGGVAVAGLGTFAVTGAVLLHDRSTVRADCDARRRCSPDGLDAVHAEKTLLPVNAIALGVGVVAVGVAVTFAIRSTNVQVGGGPTAIDLRGRF